MNRKVLQIAHTVTPAETHFVVSGDEYVGILSFWVIALVKEENDETPWLSDFPIIADGNATILEQIQDDSLSVVHWAEMRQWLQLAGLSANADLVVVRDLLDCLWSGNER